ncbi:hypothetical protein BDW59DRAFT_157748 [Aspergillus cavernicola]|uniref:Secreted protein n=1 Tax=Aspergillus cavernicola TaxID=176166 RepID=A0ABR4IY89_9EURO
MRFLLTLLIALFAVMASGSHQVRCAGRAIAAPVNGLADCVTYLRWVADGVLWSPGPKPPKEHTLGPNSCEPVVCIHGAQVRWCNDDTKNPRTMKVVHMAEGANVLLHECQDTWKGERVAGGVLSHPDKWSLVVQSHEDCRPGH